MKILLFGSNGFIGQNVAKVLASHQLLLAAKKNTDGGIELDLTDPKQVEKVIKRFMPDVIINCAGVVENGPKARLNVVFTRNILEAVNKINIKPKIIICGSASIYGIVKKKDLPISETHTADPANEYAKAKYEEESLALSFSEKHDLDIVVARIFNPIGVGMRGRFLIASLIDQIKDVLANKKARIEINRTDSLRDYLDIKDIALALKSIAENKTNYSIYNIGSGEATSNGKILNLLLGEYGLQEGKVKEVSKVPEPLFACQADISRILNDIGWQPQFKLEDTVKEIVRAHK